MAKRTYKTEKVGPASSNKFLIPKTFIANEDSFVSTGATSQAVGTPIVPKKTFVKQGGKPDKGPQGAPPSTGDTSFGDFSNADALGTVGSLVNPIAGLVGTGIGVAIDKNKAVKQLSKPTGISPTQAENELDGFEGFFGALTGGILGDTIGTQVQNLARKTAERVHKSNIDKDLKDTPTMLGAPALRDLKEKAMIDKIDAANKAASKSAENAGGIPGSSSGFQSGGGTGGIGGDRSPDGKRGGPDTGAGGQKSK